MRNSKQKQEACCQKYRRLPDLWDYHRSDRAEQPEKEVEL